MILISFSCLSHEKMFLCYFLIISNVHNIWNYLLEIYEMFIIIIIIIIIIITKKKVNSISVLLSQERTLQCCIFHSFLHFLTPIWQYYFWKQFKIKILLDLRFSRSFKSENHICCDLIVCLEGRRSLICRQMKNKL